MGRPSEFDKKYIEQAYIAACEGFTDAKLAKLFGVSKVTLEAWKKENEEFLNSIKKGRDEHDSDRVEKSLRRRALGYYYFEIVKEPVIIKRAKGGDPAEIESDELVVTKRTKKHVAPDTTAIIFWLKNRQPQRWRDVQKFEMTNKITFDDEERQFLKEVAKSILNQRIKDNGGQ